MKLKITKAQDFEALISVSVIGLNLEIVSDFDIRAWSFFSRIYRRRIQLRFGREIIVDCHCHAVAQFKNSGAHYRLARF